MIKQQQPTQENPIIIQKPDGVKILKKQKKLKNQTKFGKIKVTDRINITNVKIKMLNKLGYDLTNQNRVELQILTYLGASQIPYYVSVASNENFLYLIRRQIEMNLTPNDDMIMRQNAQAFYGFDSDGSFLDPEDVVMKLIPKKPPCDNKKNLKCVFCSNKQSNSDMLKICGKFYGPYGDSYFHLFCALWCPRVCYSKVQNDLIGIQSQIKQSKRLFCKICTLSGARLGCALDSCQTSVHFPCAFNAGYNMNWLNYTFYCSKQCQQKCCIQQQQYLLLKDEQIIKNMQMINIRNDDQDDEDPQFKPKRLKSKKKDINKSNTKPHSKEKKKQIKSMIFK